MASRDRTGRGLRRTRCRDGGLPDPAAATPGRAQDYPDLSRRLEHLRLADAGNFDRIVSFDPLLAASADPITPIWRSFPIPVSDAFFAPVRHSEGPPKIMFTGRSTPHQRVSLNAVKHDFQVVHLAHGVTDDHLVAFLAESRCRHQSAQRAVYPNLREPRQRVPRRGAAGDLASRSRRAGAWSPASTIVEIAAAVGTVGGPRQSCTATPDAFRTHPP